MDEKAAGERMPRRGPAASPTCDEHHAPPRPRRRLTAIGRTRRMNMRDPFDDLLARRLRETAPRGAPDRLLDQAMSRVSATPQRGGRTWSGSPFGRLLALAAVIALAILVGTQLPGILDNPVGTDASPSISPPDSSAEGSNAPSGSPTRAPSASAGAPDETEPAVAADDLELRLVTAGGGPTYPGDRLPE